MANEIRISASITPVNVNSADTGDDGSIESKSVDANVGRSFGGSYNSIAYTDDKIISYIGYVVNDAYTALNLEWYQEAGTKNGFIPSSVKAIAVEFTGELGSAGPVNLQIEGEEVAELDVGEGVVFPWSSGVTPTNIDIKANAYSSGTNEATVNVFLIGT